MALPYLRVCNDTGEFLFLLFRLRVTSSPLLLFLDVLFPVKIAKRFVICRPANYFSYQSCISFHFCILCALDVFSLYIAVFVRFVFSTFGLQNFSRRSQQYTHTKTLITKRNKSMKSSSSASTVQPLLTVLEELRRHAAEAEREVWDLNDALRIMEDECESLRATLRRRRPGALTELDQKEKEAAAARDAVHKRRCGTLEAEIRRLEQEVRDERKEKSRLLGSVSYTANGGPRVTLVDRPLLEAGSRPASVLGLSLALEKLPDGAADTLHRNKWFLFASKLCRSVLEDHRRNGQADVVSAVVQAVNVTGTRSKLLEATTVITDPDWAKM